MKMTRKQILEQIEQVVAGQIEKKIGDAFLFPKIPTNTVSTGQAAATVQYPKATEIAEYEAKIQAEIAAARQRYMTAGRGEKFEYLEIVHLDGTIERVPHKIPPDPKESAEIHGVQRGVSVDEFAAALKAREQEERHRREAEEQRAREQYQADGRWGQF